MSKKEPLLSVIVPVYNTEQYIEKCVNSILKQTYMAIEIILVDDGSSDQSGLICDLLAEKNTCIKVLHTENRGITKARLAGVKASTARKVTFVDADDWIAEDAYRELFFECDYDVIITGICRYIDPEHQIMQFPFLQEGTYDRKGIIDKIAPVMLWTPQLEYWALDPSLCTKIFKREILLEQLEKASVVESNYGEDSIVIFPLMLQAEYIQITKKIYYYHLQRVSGEMPSYIRDDEFISKLSNVYEYLKQQFKQTSYWDVMKKQLDCFFINAIAMKKLCYNYSTLEFAVYFPIEKIPQNSSVVLYGAGNLGRKYWEQNSKYHFCNIKLWVDKNYEKIQSDNQYIQNPEMIGDIDFDYILIAVDDYYVAKEIAFYLEELGVKKSKIVWHSVRINNKKFE